MQGSAAATSQQRQPRPGAARPAGWWLPLPRRAGVTRVPAALGVAEHRGAVPTRMFLDTAPLRVATAAERLWHERLTSSAEAGVSPRVEEELRLAAARDALTHNAWAPRPHHLSQEALWQRLRVEARALAEGEPAMASKLHMTVLMHDRLEKSMAFLLANKLSSETLLATQLTRLVREAYEDDPSLMDAAVADLQAVYERDPACDSYIQCMLFFKGFQAIQSQRVAHWMWLRGRRALALALQSRMSEVFSVDVHPAARIGRGVMMDHATGIVIGETAVIGDNVSMLHHVTLGGSGTGHGSRHPVVGNGVLLGAGVSVLGPVVVGACSKIGAGSVVVTSLPPHVVAVGVPAKVVKRLADFEEPVAEMDQVSGFILDWVI